MERNTDGLYALSSKNIPVRIGLAFVLLLVLVIIWFAVSLQLGNLLAEVTKPTDSDAKSIAEMAVSLSPRDPLTQWLKATLEQEADPQKISGFEKTVRLSPSDYRWWIQLGRAYEQADKSSEAEAAFKYAIGLAPNYVLPHWHAGNFYLRQGKDDEGFAALKKAAFVDPIYREQVYSVLWDFYEQDSKRLDMLAGDNPGVIAGLAKFYAVKRIPDKSLEAWNRLSPAERAKNEDIARLVMQAFYETGYFRTSVAFAGQLEAEKGAAVGRIYNGGFESEIYPPDKAFFSWKISNSEDIRIQTNSFKKHKGKRSLELSFSGYKKPVIYNVFQTVAVEAGAKYRISFWFKTENLASMGMPVVEVTDVPDGRVLAFSKPMPTGTNDWQEMSFEFEAPANAEGIGIRTNREYCGESCLLTGTLFYDDFELKRIN